MADSPVSDRRIELAKAGGLVNVEALALACRRAEVPFAVACALFSKESGGRNIYGHDVGGAFSTRDGSVLAAGVRYPEDSDIPVTPANAAEFLLMIGAGHKSNGMGPTQITWAADLNDGRTGGYFRLMTDLGLVPWRAEDNMYFGLRLLKGHFDRLGSWEEAGTAYNGKASYGADLVKWIQHWREVFED